MIDSYSTRARMFPVYITISPVILVLAALLPKGLDLPLAGAAVVVLVPLSFLASQVGADFGKRLEKGLWKKWGGPPTTRFLRRGSSEYNAGSRERIHAKLRASGLSVPSEHEEIEDRGAADSNWVTCTEELIRRTRNKKKYPLVFKGLVEYGFRRNLLGLKKFGLPICILSLLACVWSVWSTSNSNEVSAVGVSATLLIIGLLLVWLVWVTETMVSVAANRYARFLLEASLDLD